MPKASKSDRAWTSPRLRGEGNFIRVLRARKCRCFHRARHCLGQWRNAHEPTEASTIRLSIKMRFCNKKRLELVNQFQPFYLCQCVDVPFGKGVLRSRTQECERAAFKRPDVSGAVRNRKPVASNIAFPSAAPTVTPAASPAPNSGNSG